jgi:glycosyltransferase involved in cell wall biosynthesis
MRIAVAHEWLVSYAGSERVVDEILGSFPDARLLTTVIERDGLPPRLQRAEPSLLQRIPGASGHHEWLLPLMPLSWAVRAPVGGVDAIVSSSHACAKAVRVESGIPHLCYSHTPMRYAWDFELEQERFPPPTRPLARVLMAWFRRWDRRTAENVDAFVANSSAVAARIRRFYDRRAQVIHPPVRTDRFTPGGERKDVFLYVGRLTGYKRPDLVVEAFAGLDEPLVVVGDGPLAQGLRARASANVSFLGNVDEDTLLGLYRSARALVYPVDEDFGIAMAEAQACGTPVIGLNRGGALDIVEDGTTGWLIDRPTVEELRKAIRLAARVTLDAGEIRRRAERFGAPRFREEITAAVGELVAAAREPGGLRRFRAPAGRPSAS